MEAVLDRRRDTMANFPFPPDSNEAIFQRTLDYIWTTCRTAIYVLVRDYRIRVFMPFCNNSGFHNTWSSELVFQDPDMERLETLPKDRWWCNAGILCTRPQGSRGYSTYGLDCYRDMLDTVLRERPIQHTEFFLNRRDNPLVRRDGRHPYTCVWRTRPPVVCTHRLLPILSPYVGPDYHDRCIPTVVCWSILGDRIPRGFDGDPLARVGVSRPHRWTDRDPRAFFRGTATNLIRVDMVRLLGSDTLFDIGLVPGGKSRRMRVHAGQVTWPPSVDTTRGNKHTATDWVDPSEWGRYRVILAPDGHVGLNRWAHLIRSGAWIIRIMGDTVAPGTMLGAMVPHTTVDTRGREQDQWAQEIRARVQELVARPHGPEYTGHGIRAAMLDGVRDQLE